MLGDLVPDLVDRDACRNTPPLLVEMDGLRLCQVSCLLYRQPLQIAMVDGAVTRDHGTGHAASALPPRKVGCDKVVIGEMRVKAVKVVNARGLPRAQPLSRVEAMDGPHQPLPLEDVVAA